MRPCLSGACLRALFLLVIVATLWNLSEACTAGKSTSHPDVCNQYYVCVQTGGVLVNILQNCPAGQNFDPSRGFCTATYDCMICD